MTDEPSGIAIKFSPDGKARCIYKDEHLNVYDALGDLKVQRASNVEWEKIGGLGLCDLAEGWSVRSAHDPELAIRIVLENGQYRKVVSKEGEICLFLTRGAALENEIEQFWALLPPEEKNEHGSDNR
jgi:hypothetical protein